MNASFIKSVNGLTSLQSDPRTIGKEIIFYEETVSTNDDVLRLSKEYGEGLVIVADSQKGGRGRHGRRWFSPPGINLYFSILLKPSSSLEKVTILPLMASAAVVKGIEEHAGIHTSIKWPNDIMRGGKKVGGILMEMKTAKGKICAIALGIGLNVNMTSDMFPEEIKNIATSLRIESRMDIDRFKLLKKILREIDCWYTEFLKGNSRDIVNEWLKLNSTTGHEVIVQEIGGREIRGTAEGIDEMGYLLIRLSSGIVERVSAGDVTILA